MKKLKYIIELRESILLYTNTETGKALYTNEVLKKLNEHTEIHEVLKWAYEVLSRVDHSYTERNTPEGQMKLSNMRFILKQIES